MGVKSGCVNRTFGTHMTGGDGGGEVGSAEPVPLNKTERNLSRTQTPLNVITYIERYYETQPVRWEASAAHLLHTRPHLVGQCKLNWVGIPLY